MLNSFKMPNPLTRYIIIDRMLNRASGASLNSIKEAVANATGRPVTDNTLKHDFVYMRRNGPYDFNAPIAYNRYTKKYYYTKPGYSIFKNNISINRDEAASLIFAANVLKQFQKMEIFSSFKSAIQQLINTMNIRTEQTINNILVKKIDTEAPVELKGSRHIDPIINALKTNTVLEIKYKSYTGNAKEHTVSPYLLKEYRNRWYLVGFSHKDGIFKTYALDRILSLSPHEGLKFVYKQFDPMEYYKHATGITVVNEEPQEIIIAFDKLESKYIKDLPLHRSQKLIEEKEDEDIFSFFLIPTFEFTSQILGLSGSARVISPESYRDEIIKLHKEALDRYKG